MLNSVRDASPTSHFIESAAAQGGAPGVVGVGGSGGSARGEAAAGQESAPRSGQGAMRKEVYSDHEKRRGVRTRVAVCYAMNTWKRLLFENNGPSRGREDAGCHLFSDNAVCYAMDTWNRLLFETNEVSWGREDAGLSFVWRCFSSW